MHSCQGLPRQAAIPLEDLSYSLTCFCPTAAFVPIAPQMLLEELCSQHAEPTGIDPCQGHHPASAGALRGLLPQTC